MSQKRQRWLLLAVISGLVFGAASPAAAQDLSEIREEISFFKKRIRNLERRFLEPQLLKKEFQLETHYNDGKVAYFLEDYSKASILLVDVVSRANPRSFASYNEAVFLLADSLYHTRNFLSAEKYFKKVVARGSRGEFYTQSIRRLVAIADETGDYEDVDKYYEQLEAQSDTPSAALSYGRAKNLYKRERYGEARKYFQRALKSDVFAFQARYFLAVAYAAEKKFDKSHEQFEKLVALEPETDRQRYISKLGYLGLGRIAYEQGKYNEAIDFYQRLPRQHRKFDRAVYELSWALVQLEKFEVAQRNLEILLSMTDPDPDLAADARLLRADLAARNQDYQEAVSQYDQVIEHYNPLRRSMRQLASEQSDLKAFFREISNEALSDPQVAQQMPRRIREWFRDSARHWLANSKAMSSARFIVEDLDSVGGDLEESRQILDQMRARLESGARVKIFPKLKEGLSLAIGLENQIIDVRSKLLEREGKLVASQMDSEQRKTWKKMRDEFADILERFEDVPRTAEGLRTRERKVLDDFGRLRRKLDKIGYEIQSMKKQLSAIDEFMENPDRKKLSAEDRKEVMRMRGELRSNIEEYEKIREKLRQRVAVERQRTGLGDAVTEKEGQLRETVRAYLARQREYLMRFHDDVGGTKQEELRTITSLREQLPPIEARVDGYYKRMNEILDARTKDYRVRVEEEAKILEARVAELERLDSESRRVTGEIVHDYFVRSYRNIDELVLRADVGRTNVLFQRKQDKTEEIDQLFEDRTEELQLLEKTFQQVR
jgi:tetratricopeptide (TPR) repeat protein